MSEQAEKKISGGKYAVIRLKLIRKYWYGGRCMHINDDETQCSKTHNLELAHAIDTELSKNQTNCRASLDRLHDTMENPQCFLLFCAKHHREFDGRTSDLWKEDYYGGRNK